MAKETTVNVRKFGYRIPVKDTREDHRGPLCPDETYGQGFEIVLTEINGQVRDDTGGIEIYAYSVDPRNTIDFGSGKNLRQNLSNLSLPNYYRARVYPAHDEIPMIHRENDVVAEPIEAIPAILRAMADKIEELTAEQAAKNPPPPPPQQNAREEEKLA
jgi:hypothetical protein